MNLVRRLLACLALVLMAFAVARPAEATWSIVAVDPETREVGLAAAACSVGVQHIAAVVPGRGVIASQAATSLIGRNKARKWIAGGQGATGILAALQNRDLYRNWFASDLPVLQYGVVTLGDGSGTGAEAGFVTGTKNFSWAGGEAGADFSVQGNTLRNADVVSKAAQAFRDAGRDRDGGACPPPLAERLLRALEAGRDAGGDNRCPAAAPALAAVLIVAGPDDPADDVTFHEVAPRSFSLAANVWYNLLPYQPDPTRQEPVAELRKRYEAATVRRDCR